MLSRGPAAQNPVVWFEAWPSVRTHDIGFVVYCTSTPTDSQQKKPGEATVAVRLSPGFFNDSGDFFVSDVQFRQVVPIWKIAAVAEPADAPELESDGSRL